MSEYRIARRAKICSASGEAFADGEEIISAIFDGEEGFERRDYRADLFEETEEVYSHWRSRVPATTEEQRKLDLGLARTFLERLLEEGESHRRGLAYALALLLSRKRRVRLGTPEAEEGQQILPISWKTEAGEQTHRLAVPHFAEGEIEAVQEELEGLFDAPPIAEGAEEPDPTPDPA